MKRKILFLYGLQQKDFEPDNKIKEMKAYLERYGFEIYASHYSHCGPTTKPLWIYAREVRREIEQIKPEAIIGHSMGGLIARYIIETNPGINIRKLIILETPNRGVPRGLTPLAKLLGYQTEWSSFQCMIAGSAFLKRLEEPKATTPYFQIGGFYSLIFPSVFLIPNLPAKIFPNLTHSQLRRNPKVLAYIKKILSSPLFFRARAERGFEKGVVL